MAEEKKGFFKRLVEGLSKTRENIVSVKKSWLWEISGSIPLQPSLKD